MLSVPDVRVVRFEESADVLGDPEQVVAAVLMRLLGDATGRTGRVFSGAAAQRLVSMMPGCSEVPFPDGFGASERTALEQLGTGIVGAYLNALSDLMGMLLIPSHGEMCIDTAAAVLATSYVDFGEVDDVVFCLSTELYVDNSRELSANFLLLPDGASLMAMLRALRLA
jgi:chemotaxis protein CheC